MNLSITPTTARVGVPSLYEITGGPPGAALKWSSTKNGVPTGENLTYYGQHLDAGGSFAQYGEAWGSSYIGEWEKIVTAELPDGTTATAADTFAVVAAGTTSTPTTTPYTSPQGGGGFFDGSFNVGGAQIPKVAAYAGLAAAVIFLMPSGGGRR